MDGQDQFMCNLLKEISSDVKKIKSDIESLKETLLNHEENHKVTEEKLNSFESRITGLEKSINACNLVLYKVTDNADTNKDLISTVGNIFTKAGVDIPNICIASVYRVGRQIGTRPIIIKFIAPRWKKVIFEKAKKFAELNLAIGDDLSKEAREHKKRLLRVRYLLRKDGKQTILKRNCIYLDDQPLTLSEINDILDREPHDNKGDNNEEDNNHRDAEASPSINSRPGSNRTEVSANEGNKTAIKRGRPGKENKLNKEAHYLQKDGPLDHFFNTSTRTTRSKAISPK